MQNLPLYISIAFIATTILAIWLFVRATKSPKTTLLILSCWLILQAFISLSGFYTVTATNPPRLGLLILPPLLGIALLFFTPAGRKYLDELNIRGLTILHIVRIPVELILFSLFLYQKVPRLMTFEGGNLDILSGLTAIPIFYYGFVKKRLTGSIILSWNSICILLLLNIVMRALLSAPFAFQKLAFDQPNIAILYFPFVWLPGCVVPLVLLAHLAAIRKLFKEGKTRANSGAAI